MNGFEEGRYKVVTARYHPSPIREHAGNKLIEALPPLSSDEDALTAVCWRPAFSVEERSLPTSWRIARVLELRNLMIPLERHSEVVLTLNAMLRSGYGGRPLNSPERNKAMQQLYEMRQQGQSFRQCDQASPMALSAALIGVPGTGKTSLVARWCLSLPEAIYHPTENVYQIPALWAEAPPDGNSVKGFCYSILHELDRRIPGATYYREFGARGRPSDAALLSNVVHLLNAHCLGILFLDEAQNFANSVKNGQIVMTEIVSAFNLLRMPLVFMGTNKTYSVFDGEFRAARRFVTVPLPHWDRLRYTPNTGAPDEWSDLVLALWRFQWVRNPVELDELTLQVLYECSQGIPAILVALFAAAQKQAMLDGSEQLAQALIERVYREKFKLVHPMVSALRDDDYAALERYQDLCPSLTRALDGVLGVAPADPRPAGRPGETSDAQTLYADPRMACPRSKARKSRIPTRMPQARTAVARKEKQEAQTAEQEPLQSGDYRHALAASAKRNSSAHDEFLHLGYALSTDQVLDLLE